MSLPHDLDADSGMTEDEHGLRHLLQEVLDLAYQYSRDSCPAMQARDRATKEIAEALKALLRSVASSLGLEHLDLDVELGGRHGSYGPVPWVRIFSRHHAPRAHEGFYLVYLFAADGSRAYLSLMQGTSEFRAGKLRPVADSKVLVARSAEARSLLRNVAGTLVDEVDGGGIDLAWRKLSSGTESRKRIRNYEDGTVVALPYVSRKLPSDSQLLQDIVDLLPLLASLYHEPVNEHAAEATRPTGPGPYHATARAGRGVARLRQGRLLDPVVRKAIEVCAEDLAETDLRRRGWKVERVGTYNRGYDLECRHPDGHTLHVEVKGTQSLGDEVVLTPKEVRHTEPATGCEAEHALFIASEIRISHDNGVIALGGKGRWLWPWAISPDDLFPTEYAYRPPAQDEMIN
ncbi:MrcB family domain-containing protein [Micromonospora purpureochromogenes]|nr:DUF3578 domain-containing protein [Micromonospora purpureochromogenes]